MRLVDCMPPRDRHAHLIRVVEGIRGRVPIQMRLAPRFDYGRLIPSFGRIDQDVFAVAGPDAIYLQTPIDLRQTDGTASATFTISEGERVPFHLVWYPSHLPHPEPADPFELVASAVAWWGEWSGRCQYAGPYRDDVIRSLITLKALTYTPTGAIVAALTTSLPEEIGGERNWDYRYCWLRDGAFTLAPLVRTGYLDEAVAWRDWLLRAIAGDPGQIQLMYGIGGEHRLTEHELPWLSGYEDSKPVRIGNAAYDQFQLDIFGEVLGVLYTAWKAGLPERADPTRSPGIDFSAAIEVVERRWREPDEGIWEVRAERQHFTSSKVSAWTALDRAVKLMRRPAAPRRLSVGAACAMRSTPMSVRMASIRNVTRSSSTTGRRAWMPAFCSSRSADFLHLKILVCWGRSMRSDGEICSGPFVWRYSTDEEIDGLAGRWKGASSLFVGW